MGLILRPSRVYDEGQVSWFVLGILVALSRFAEQCSLHHADPSLRDLCSESMRGGKANSIGARNSTS